MRARRFKLMTSALGGFAVAASASIASAQTGSSDLALEEIVVTARKRAESQQDTPISIAAFQGEDLSRRRVENMRDLMASVPNFSAVATQAGSSANAQLYLRGVGQNDFRVTSDQAVGLYLDGVYIARSMGASLDVVDIERVEVLRGPQGTLFGRNSVAGAVQFVTVQPKDEWEGSLELGLGSRDRFDLKGMINAPLVEGKLAARLSAARLRQDGYGYRILQDVDTGDTHNEGARLQLLFTPSDDVRFLLAVDGSRRRGNSSVETLLAILAPENFAAYNADLIAQGLKPITAENFITGDPYTSWAGAPNGDDYDNWGVTLTSEWTFSDTLALKSITAFRDLETSSNYDFGAVPYPAAWQGFTIDQKQFSQELQLSFTGMDGRLKGVAGAYLFREKGVQNEFDPYYELPIANGACNVCFTLPNPAINAYWIYLNQKTKSHAAFAQVSFEVTDALTTTVGLRYTHDRKRLTESLTYNNTYQDFFFARPLGTHRNSWNDVSPHLSLEYKLDADKLLYFTVSKGFRAGGYNGVSFEAAAPESFDPETIIAYEVGAKTEWLNRRVRFNISSFLYDYRDVVGFSFVDAAVTIRNIGKFWVYGGEAELTALLTDSLQLSATAGFLDQDLRKVAPGGEFSIREDSRLTNMPKFSADVTLQYNRDIEGLGEITALASVSRKGAHEFLLPNRPGEAENGYTLFNASLSFVPELGGKRPLEFTLYGRNLTDEAYKIYAENGVDYGFGLLYAQFGKPREWGVTAKYKF